jgi:lycopene beta-cyclase
MTISVAAINRIIAGISITIYIDACQYRVPGVRREEASKVGVVVSGVQVLQAGFGVEALVDVGLALQDGGAVGGEGIAVGTVVVSRGGLTSGHVGHLAAGGEMVFEAPAGDAALALHIGVEITGEQASGVHPIDQQLRVTSEIGKAVAQIALARPLAIGGVGEGTGVAVLGDGEVTFENLDHASLCAISTGGHLICKAKKSQEWPLLLKNELKNPPNQNAHWPLILVGAGLASALIAQRLSVKNNSPKILMLEGSDAPFGEHTWSFHIPDIGSDDLTWIDPLVAHHWNGQSVRFRGFRRDLTSGYASLSSASVAGGMANLGNLTIKTGASVAEIAPDRVGLADGTAFTADCVIDARGYTPSPALVLGHQKFVGLEVETTKPHGLANPIIMDASVDQHDGYRFVYVLPFSPTRLLIEDTRYSDGDALDLQALTRDISAYAETQNWSIARVVRSEHGVLPIALAHDVEKFWQDRPTDIPQAGMRAALFHPTTGYSLPESVRVANLVAEAWPVGSAVLAERIRRHAHTSWGQQRFYRLLNRMLFRAALPDRRHLVLQRFYTLPQPLIERFYGGRTSVSDMARILIGKPPVPIRRALSCLRERPLLMENNK